MSESTRNPKVDSVIASRSGAWGKEMEALREVMLGCPVTEEIKWGWPAYGREGKNIVVIHAFKAYCAALFFKGALLKDPEGVLIQQTENVQSARQMRFTSVEGVGRLKGVLQAYVEEAIALETAGAKAPRKTTADFEVPAEFRHRMDDDPDLRAAFGALTPGRQRGYLFHFAQAKQSKTREARIEKCIPSILAGKGLGD